MVRDRLHVQPVVDPRVYFQSSREVIDETSGGEWIRTARRLSFGTPVDGDGDGEIHEDAHEREAVDVVVDGGERVQPANLQPEQKAENHDRREKSVELELHVGAGQFHKAPDGHEGQQDRGAEEGEEERARLGVAVGRGVLEVREDSRPLPRAFKADLQDDRHHHQEFQKQEDDDGLREDSQLGWLRWNDFDFLGIIFGVFLR